MFRRRASAPIYTCTSFYGNSRNLALSASSVLSSRRSDRPLTDLQSPAYSKGNQCGSRAVCSPWMLSLPWSKATLSLRQPWAAKSQTGSSCLLQPESPFSSALSSLSTTLSKLNVPLSLESYLYFCRELSVILWESDLSCSTGWRGYPREQVRISWTSLGRSISRNRCKVARKQSTWRSPGHPGRLDRLRRLLC